MRQIKQIKSDLEIELKKQKAFVAKHGKEGEIFKMAIDKYSTELKKAMGL